MSNFDVELEALIAEWSERGETAKDMIESMERWIEELRSGTDT